jgi:hypothetical protein
MALRRDDLQPPKILRAHRPRTSDALQQPASDAQQEPVTQELVPRRGLVASHWHHLLIGVMLFLGFYLVLSRLVLPFIIQTQEQWNYGYSRVSVVDLNVGHGSMSHFITQYYKDQIVVIEMPVNHPERSKIYSLSETVVGDTGQHVITLTTTYVRKNAIQGKPDLVVSVSGFAVPVVLYNTGDSFTTGA